MRKHAPQFILVALTVALFAVDAAATQKYVSPTARGIIYKMIEAHGGYDKWRSIPTLSYQHDMLIPGHEDAPWRTLEVIDPRTRAVHQEWPLDDATLVCDGKDTWTVGWKKLNPPGMMAHVSFFFMNLPFITQDPSVIITAVGTSKDLRGSGDDTEYITVRMQYDPDKGASEYEYYDLFINPETHLLHAVNYTVTYKPLIRVMTGSDEKPFLGPLYKVYDSFADVGGLKIASEYTTYRGDQPYGRHVAKDFSTKTSFKDEWLQRPADAALFVADEWPPEQPESGS